MKTTKQNKKENVVLNTTNEFKPMSVSIIIKQGANVLSRIIEQKKYNDEFSDLVASKFDLFKGAFNGKNKIFDTTLNMPILFEMHIKHEIYSDIIKGEIETNNAKKICILLNNEFCKTFVGAPSYNVVKLERAKYTDRKNKMAMAKETRHTFVGTAGKLETAMLYPIAKLN
jgi:hypothetical protein